MEEESNPFIRKLLQQDSSNLDRMQVQMVAAREFLIIIRLKKEDEKVNHDRVSDIFHYLSRIENKNRMNSSNGLVKGMKLLVINRSLLRYFHITLL